MLLQNPIGELEDELLVLGPELLQVLNGPLEVEQIRRLQERQRPLVLTFHLIQDDQLAKFLVRLQNFLRFLEVTVVESDQRCDERVVGLQVALEQRRVDDRQKRFRVAPERLGVALRLVEVDLQTDLHQVINQRHQAVLQVLVGELRHLPHQLRLRHGRRHLPVDARRFTRRQQVGKEIDDVRRVRLELRELQHRLPELLVDEQVVGVQRLDLVRDRMFVLLAFVRHRRQLQGEEPFLVLQQVLTLCRNVDRLDAPQVRDRSGEDQALLAAFPADEEARFLKFRNDLNQVVLLKAAGVEHADLNCVRLQAEQIRLIPHQHLRRFAPDNRRKRFVRLRVENGRAAVQLRLRVLRLARRRNRNQIFVLHDAEILLVVDQADARVDGAR